jgi:hypothetical protein
VKKTHCHFEKDYFLVTGKFSTAIDVIVVFNETVRTVVVKIVVVFVVVIVVVEGMTVVVLIGVVVDRIVLLLECVPEVWFIRSIVDSNIGFIEFDVRSANATKKKKEVIEKSIKFRCKSD